MKCVWESGDSPAAVTPDGVVVLGAGHEEQVHEIWEMMHSGTQFTSMVQVLTTQFGGNFTTFPAFAIVVREGRNARVAVRGGFTVSVRVGEQVSVLDGRSLVTWDERQFDRVDAWAISGPRPETTMPGARRTGWARDAVVPMSRLSMGQLWPEPKAVGATISTPVAAVAAPAASVPHAAQPDAASEPAAVPESAAASESVVTEQAAASEPAVASEPASAPEPAAAAESVVLPAEPVVLVPEPLVMTAEAGGSQPDSIVVVAEPVPATPAPPVWQEPVEQCPLERESVPRPSHSPSEPIVIDGEAAEYHDGLTIDYPQQAVSPFAPPTTSAHTVAQAPEVLSVPCINGHHNPPYLQRCRVCGKAMSRTLARIERPSLGRLVLSDGEVVELDRDLVFGRNPRDPHRAGRPNVRLVTVGDQDNDISRNHCEIRIEGWDARIRDLGSQNGTFLTHEGQETQRVSETAPVILRCGDVINLGGNFSMRLEC